MADALRIAREIVLHEGAELALAARGAEEAAIDEAGARLATRIAQAILDAERDSAERLAPPDDSIAELGVSNFLRTFRLT